MRSRSHRRTQPSSGVGRTTVWHSGQSPATSQLCVQRQCESEVIGHLPAGICHVACPPRRQDCNPPSRQAHHSCECLRDECKLSAPDRDPAAADAVPVSITLHTRDGDYPSNPVRKDSLPLPGPRLGHEYEPPRNRTRRKWRRLRANSWAARGAWHEHEYREGRLSERRVARDGPRLQWVYHRHRVRLRAETILARIRRQILNSLIAKGPRNPLSQPHLA